LLARSLARSLACSHARTHARTHACTHARMHACTHARMHAHTHVHLSVDSLGTLRDKHVRTVQCVSTTATITTVRGRRRSCVFVRNFDGLYVRATRVRVCVPHMVYGSLPDDRSSVGCGEDRSRGELRLTGNSERDRTDTSYASRAACR